MKRFLKWTAIVAGAGFGTVFVVRGIQAGRQRIKNALGDAEAIANQTRETLAQTQKALHDARHAI
jgi:ABC-type transporter Mla subunit MlaD